MPRFTNNFYRYIYKKGNGYRIIFNNQYFGWYDHLPTCLYDRDRLEACGFDVDKWFSMPHTPNPYEHILLPNFDKSTEFITHIPERWRVQKRINGKVKTFGQYESLEKAQEVRDYWISRNWSE